MSQSTASATLLVTRTSGEVRVAVVEDGTATAFYFERDGERDRKSVV